MICIHSFFSALLIAVRVTSGGREPLLSLEYKVQTLLSQNELSHTPNTQTGDILDMLEPDVHTFGLWEETEYPENTHLDSGLVDVLLSLLPSPILSSPSS